MKKKNTVTANSKNVRKAISKNAARASVSQRSKANQLGNQPPAQGKGK
jgi:hypothetical protein